MNYDAYWKRLRRANQLAAEYSCTAVQIALAWVLNQPQLNLFAIIGPHTLAELASSLAAVELDLTLNQMTWLNLESEAETPR